MPTIFTANDFFARLPWILTLFAACPFSCKMVVAQGGRNQAPYVPALLAPDIELLQPGVKLTLLAEHPNLVTPTGIDVDDEGNIWLIACHTHFRPEGYLGPEHDEILVFDKEGKNRRVFYNQTDATMHVELGPDGWVYLVERDRILRVKDNDSDGRGDIEENIAVLDTVADYPHNGLSGMAWDPRGGLVFALGENFEKAWTLTGHDGLQARGRGEGGIFWCTAEGEKMRRLAHGFWNPFGLLVRDDGEIFAAENDPGSRPPCRLLNIVEGADYGYQRAYGNAAVHPFVAWNGELRGTLGMICPTSEAPCAIVALGGGVMIPSWSSHCIDYFPLHRKGAGYTSNRIELLRGRDFFRPVGMAQGPDGAFYLTDWVFSSYQLHGRGRLWKLEIDAAEAYWIKANRDSMNASSLLAKALRKETAILSNHDLFALARGNDAYLSDAALTALAHSSQSWSVGALRALADNERVWALVAFRRAGIHEEKWVRAMLDDPDPEIQFECLRWIADGELSSFSSEVKEILMKSDLNFRLFEAALAAWHTLQGKPDTGVTDAAILVERIVNPSTPARLKGYALRLAPASHPKLTIGLLREFLKATDASLAIEAVRTLGARNSPDAWNLLTEIARSDDKPPTLRAEAIAGLATSTESEHQALMVQLAGHPNQMIREEALRGLRTRPTDDSTRRNLLEILKKYPESADLVAACLDPTTLVDSRPRFDDIDGWMKRLDAIPGTPNPAVGRRVFFHPSLASCANCHRYNGRGNVVGPELSLIGKQGNRAHLLESILEPDRDLAPQFYTTLLELDDGSVFSGILLRSSNKDVFRDLLGKERTFEKSDILQRKELKTSMMPTGLVTRLTDRELRDLVAFLESTDSDSN